MRPPGGQDQSLLRVRRDPGTASMAHGCNGGGSDVKLGGAGLPEPHHGPRDLVADPDARYFEVRLGEETLVPGDDAILTKDAFRGLARSSGAAGPVIRLSVETRRERAVERRLGAEPHTRVAILSSERGRHVQALLEDAVVGSWIALVVADHPDAYALNHARWHGVPAVALRAGKSDLDLYDLALTRVLGEHAIDYVVVAGFPRIVGAETVRTYQNRTAKVHHSLLPEFPGPAPVAEASEQGATRVGVMVHLIGRNLEVGPIVSQEALEIRKGETLHSLVERIHRLELRLLPEAVHALVEGAPMVDLEAGDRGGPAGCRVLAEEATGVRRRNR